MAGMAGKESTAIDAGKQAGMAGMEASSSSGFGKGGAAGPTFVDRQASWRQSEARFLTGHADPPGGIVEYFREGAIASEGWLLRSLRCAATTCCNLLQSISRNSPVAAPFPDDRDGRQSDAAMMADSSTQPTARHRDCIRDPSRRLPDSTLRITGDVTGIGQQPQSPDTVREHVLNGPLASCGTGKRLDFQRLRPQTRHGCR